MIDHKKTDQWLTTGKPAMTEWRVASYVKEKYSILITIVIGIRFSNAL